MNFFSNFFCKEKNTGTQGQILGNSEFSQAITSIILKRKPKNIVEIGTWKGLGSTKVIIDAVDQGNYSSNFISLETNSNFYKIAKKNLRKYQQKVELLYGRIIKKTPYEKYAKTLNLNAQKRQWMEDDLANYHSCPNVLNLIPDQIDFLLLDGGEYSTYLEWNILQARTKIVALDDTKEEKTKRIREELSQDSSYEKLYDSQERNGFTVFIKKNFKSESVKKKNLLQINSFTKMHNGKNIFFCKTDFLEDLFKKLKNHKENLTLITGNSDFGITKSLFKKKPKCIKKWYAQNVEYRNPNLIGIPIGLENGKKCKIEGHGHVWPHAHEKTNSIISYQNTSTKSEPTKEIYCNFSTTTNKSRKKVLDLSIKSKHITVDITKDSLLANKKRSYQNYAKNLLDHRMILCPNGNGVDTHRLWETLYFGRVPIVEKSINSSFFEKLPIIFIDDWEEILDLESIKKKYEKVKNNSLEMLDFFYWKNKIEVENYLLN